MSTGITIGICEDIKKDMDELYETIGSLLNKIGQDAAIIKFHDGEALINYAKNNSLDLLLLDIKLPGINGIEIKNLFQKNRKNTIIIFVTDYADFMPEAFGIKVFGFVQKQRLQEQLSEMFPAVIQLLRDYVILENNINSKDIVYIKVEHIYCHIYMSDGTNTLVRKALKEYEEQLKEVGFIKIHRSYLVNAAHIIEWRKTSVVTASGTIPVSARLKHSTKELYDDYCRKHAKY